MKYLQNILIFLFLVGITVFATLSFVGCGDDDDDDSNGEQTECEAFCDYISECSLGNKVNATNTQECLDFCDSDLAGSVGNCVLEASGCEDAKACFDDDSDDDDSSDDDDDDDTGDDDDDDTSDPWGEKICPDDPSYVDCLLGSKTSCGYNIGDTIPNFSKKDKDGNCVTLYDFEGQVVLLDAMSAWCDGCKQSTPALQSQFYNAYHDDGFTVIQLMAQDRSSNPAKQAALEEWVETYSLTLPVVADLFPIVGNKINHTVYIPFYALVDQNMVIVAKVDFYNPAPPEYPGSLNDFHGLIQALLALK